MWRLHEYCIQDILASNTSLVHKSLPYNVNYLVPSHLKLLKVRSFLSIQIIQNMIPLKGLKSN